MSSEVNLRHSTNQVVSFITCPLFKVATESHLPYRKVRYATNAFQSHLSTHFDLEGFRFFELEKKKWFLFTMSAMMGGGRRRVDSQYMR